MSELTAEQKARAMMGEVPAAVEESPEWQAHVTEKIGKLRARGVPFNLSPEQVEAADRLGMDLQKYALYSTCRTVHDAERINRQLRAEAEARAEAERQVAVERAKKAAS